MSNCVCCTPTKIKYMSRNDTRRAFFITPLSRGKFLLACALHVGHGNVQSNCSQIFQSEESLGRFFGVRSINQLRGKIEALEFLSLPARLTRTEAHVSLGRSQVTIIVGCVEQQLLRAPVLRDTHYKTVLCRLNLLYTRCKQQQVHCCCCCCMKAEVGSRCDLFSQRVATKTVWTASRRLSRV